MKLTGNPDEDALERCAKSVYSEGGTATSHLYDVIRNPNYLIRKPFGFIDAFRFLNRKKTLLRAADVIDALKEEEKKVRPIGIKTAKRQKAEENARKQLGIGGLQQSASEMASSVKRIEEAMLASQTAKNKLAEMKVSLEKRRLDWEMSHELYGPGSDATQEERAQFSRLMRKLLLHSLEEDIETPQNSEIGEVNSCDTVRDCSGSNDKKALSPSNCLSMTTFIRINRAPLQNEELVVENTESHNQRPNISEDVNGSSSTSRYS